ncbi:MAG: hypothetical protein J6Q85_06025 [Clostridia bacterium]|nr:hypothetical protein [Clostridia bacterium]
MKTTTKFDIVDFHAHILPGADHGCISVDDALFQLNSASAQGVSRIIAAPHFYPHKHHVSTFISKRNSAYGQLRSHLTPDMPAITLGAEVLICDGIEEMPELDSLFIEGTRTLLLELPMNTFSYKYTESVEQMTRAGIDVIIAHADRYDPENIHQLLEVGARLQLNVSSLNCIFLKKHIRSWISEGKVVALGTDIHGRDKLAYKKFARAISRRSLNISRIKTESDKIWHRSKKSINT